MRCRSRLLLFRRVVHDLSEGRNQLLASVYAIDLQEGVGHPIFVARRRDSLARVIYAGRPRCSCDALELSTFHPMCYVWMFALDTICDVIASAFPIRRGLDNKESSLSSGLSCISHHQLLLHDLYGTVGGFVGNRLPNAVFFRRFPYFYVSVHAGADGPPHVLQQAYRLPAPSGRTRLFKLPRPDIGHLLFSHHDLYASSFRMPHIRRSWSSSRACNRCPCRTLGYQGMPAVR